MERAQPCGVSGWRKGLRSGAAIGVMKQARSGAPCGRWRLRGVVGLRAAGCIRVGKPGARPRPLAGSGRSAGVNFAAWWAFGRLGVSGWKSPVQGRARSRAVAAARASTSRRGGASGVDNLLLLWYTDNAPTREAAVAACQKGRPSGPPLFLLLARLVVGFAPLRTLPCAACLPPRCAPAPWGGRGVGHGLAPLRSAPYARMFALPRMGAYVAGKKAP